MNTSPHRLRHHHHHHGTRSSPQTAAVTVATPLSEELVNMIAAVRLASKLCQVVQQQLSASEHVSKPDDSPVTVADYGAQAIIAWSLARRAGGGDSTFSMIAEETSEDLRLPESAVMLRRITELINAVLTSETGEASALTPHEVLDLIDLGASDGGPVGRHFVLDPIDGTRGFVAMRQYAVCLAMLEDGKVVLNTLGCPNLPTGDGAAGVMQRSGSSGVGSLFTAMRGAGSFQVPLWDVTAPATAITVQDLSSAADGMAGARYMESFESRHSDHSLAAQVAERVGIVKPPLRMDSQVKYGLLARGAASLFMRYPAATYREKIWDHAAGVIIVEEAGGKVTDGAGRPLDFSKGRYLDLGVQQAIIAASPALHTQMLQALAINNGTVE
ncbi:MAG: hypothetical protein WDW36_006961 [Sanguina aurantia]